MLEITSLPAKQGDALWIRWGDAAATHQLFIDMGTEPIGKKIRARIADLPVDARHFDLLVITHIDADHIGGTLTAIAEADDLEGFAFDEIWFNGFEHLHGKRVVPILEPMGGPQGERLTHWLRGQAWNQVFDHWPIVRDPEGDLTTIDLHGLQLTVLGPTKQRLENLIDKWADEVKVALANERLDPAIVSPGLEPMGAWNGPPTLDTEDDLDALANAHSAQDRAKANGTSIVLLLEYDGRALLLTGDAFSDDLVDAIAQLQPAGKLKLDVLKLPHHGSRNNVHRALIEAVDCKTFLVSTDGTTFNHPDPEAIARVVRYAKRPKLVFNEPSEYNECWNDGDWQQRFKYSAVYGTAEDGYTLRFD